MPARTDLLRALLECPQADRPSEIRRLSEIERREIRYFWKLWARPAQIAPPGDWRTWLISAGRGFGKTRAGAEWVREYARRHPECRIALVGASLGEVRAVMVEGESGLLEVCPPENKPVFEPSLKRLAWANGSQAFLYSAAEPESLRGPQHDIACGTGPEGVLRQRRARPVRRVAAPRNRGTDRKPTGRARRW